VFLRQYLADTSALLNLITNRQSPVRARYLTKLVREGRLKVPDAVAREIRRKHDRLRGWVDRQKRRCIVKPTSEAAADLPRIARQYRDYLGEKAGAADAIVVCMAIYYRDSPLTPLTDDTGVQAVCHLEGVRFVTSGTFRRLEGV
jgi:rRNA maturation endonuclease Nob1